MAAPEVVTRTSDEHYITLNLDPLFLYTPRSFDSLENGPFFQACTRLFRLSRPALEQLSPMSRGLDELRRFTRPV